MPSFAQLVPPGLSVVQAVDVGDEGHLGDKTWNELSNSLQVLGVQHTGLDVFGRHYGEFPALEDHGTAEDNNWLHCVVQESDLYFGEQEWLRRLATKYMPVPKCSGVEVLEKKMKDFLNL